MERGYDAVTVTDIAERADYGRSTFYTYFADKEALLWYLLVTHMSLLDAHIAAEIEGYESPQREWLAWRAIFREIGAQRAVLLQLNGELAARLWARQRAALIDRFEGQLRDGTFSLLLDVPPEIGARFVIGAILELLGYWLLNPDAGSADDMARTLFILVYRQPPPPT